jgi:hypothetical protein
LGLKTLSQPKQQHPRQPQLRKSHKNCGENFRLAYFFVGLTKHRGIAVNQIVFPFRPEISGILCVLIKQFPVFSPLLLGGKFW